MTLHVSIPTARRRGIGLIEVVVGVSIISLVLLMSITAVTQFLQYEREMGDRVAATYLAEEGVEAMRYLRDRGWTNIAGLETDTAHYLAFGTSTIATSTDPEVIGAFTRTVRVYDVYRATADDDIRASTSPESTVLDPQTKRVEVSVTAPSLEHAVTLSAYLTDLWGDGS